MLINHDKKFIFVSVPKTASTSINVLLNNKYHRRPAKHHASISDIIEKNPKCADYFRVGFVRNPWDKFVSCYFNFTQEKSHFIWSWPIKFNYKNFRAFCHDFPNTKWATTVHFLPSFHFLSIDGELAMDFIGRFENLEKDLAKLNKKTEMFGPVLPEGWYPLLKDGTVQKFPCTVYGKTTQAAGELKFLQAASHAGGLCVLKNGRIIEHKTWVDQCLRDLIFIPKGQKDLAEEIAYWTDGKARWTPTDPECFIDLSHSRASSHESYEKYYDKETKKIIGDFYHKDVEAFNYKF